MSELTNTLPDSVHRRLETLAGRDDLPLHQFVVSALSRRASTDYDVLPVLDAEVHGQRTAFSRLLEGLGSATFDEIQQMLDERDEAQTEPGLAPEVVARLQERIATVRASR